MSEFPAGSDSVNSAESVQAVIDSLHLGDRVRISSEGHAAIEARFVQVDEHSGVEDALFISGDFDDIVNLEHSWASRTHRWRYLGSNAIIEKI